MTDKDPLHVQSAPLNYARPVRRARWVVRYWPAFLFPTAHYILLAMAPAMARDSHNPDSSAGFVLMVLVVYIADFPITYGMMLATVARDIPRDDFGYSVWLILASAYWFLIGVGLIWFIRYCHR